MDFWIGKRRPRLVVMVFFGALRLVAQTAGGGEMALGASAVAGGYLHSLALKKDRTIWGWGQNSFGQLGDGTTTNHSTPDLVGGLMDAVAIAAGQYHALASKTDGTVWAWGGNGSGQLGNGTTTNRSTPVLIARLTGVVAIGAGAEHSLALKSDGTVSAWGRNEFGQLGDGTTTNRSTPVLVTGLSGVVAIAAGAAHSLALKSDGTVWAWGRNSSGQLGDGTMADRGTPVPVSGLTGALAIAAGSTHTLAMKSGGTVWAWGSDYYGQLGDDPPSNRLTPAPVSGLAGVAAIAAGGMHSLAAKSDGTLWAWGWNAQGQLGDGTTTNRSTPVQVSGLTGVVACAGAGYHSLALKSDGTVWGWGSNGHGQLGDGTTIDHLTPVQARLAEVASGWRLVWSDEFNGPARTPPDPANWNYDLGGGGWGNGEIETYTNSSNNVFQDGQGSLVIRAIRDASGNYTSARLQTGSPGASTHTADGHWQYGRIQARIKLPFGQGVWPAFWMLGENFVPAGWPGCGEIDIMENFGTFNNNVSVSNGTAHGPGYSGGSGIGKSYTLPFGEKVADDYHVYAIEWAKDSIQWFVDGALYFKLTPASLPAGRQWVFNNPFFILLNLAIGGPSTFLGTPDRNGPFPPQDLLVDYVRVYQAAPVTPAAPVITPGGVLNVASYLGGVAPGSLAVVFGKNLADAEHLVTSSPTAGFPTSVAGVTVSVAGANAPLIYVSPTQINFQVPWNTQPSTAVEVKVTRGGVDSNSEPITIAAATAPSMFLSEFTNGVAWVTGAGCETTQCAVQPGVTYQLWANGLGPKNAPQQDGRPAVYTGSLTPLEVPGAPASCQLTIAGQPAAVTYCGAAPGLIIDQLNFIYPLGAPAGQSYADATLTINAVTGRFRVPAPLR